MSQKYLFVLGYVFLFALSMHAADNLAKDSTQFIQDSTLHKAPPKIFTALADSLEGGKVTIYQDQRLINIISTKISGTSTIETAEIQGYRVQVFSSNAPKTAKAEAFKIEKEMQAQFPDIPTYVIYNPPFWKVRLGNFRNQDESNLLRQEIINKFPTIQGDVYIVRDLIQILK